MTHVSLMIKMHRSVTFFWRSTSRKYYLTTRSQILDNSRFRYPVDFPWLRPHKIILTRPIHFKRLASSSYFLSAPLRKNMSHSADTFQMPHLVIFSRGFASGIYGLTLRLSATDMTVPNIPCFDSFSVNFVLGNIELLNGTAAQVSKVSLSRHYNMKYVSLQ